MKHMLSYNMWIIIKQIITSAHGNHIDSSIQPSNKKQSHVPLNYIPTAGYQTPFLLFSWKYSVFQTTFPLFSFKKLKVRSNC